ncbi:hypothetical protein [Mucilaginibacter sp. OK098]|uniref:hypothetical protein n=1 Tax=Mucilaginibacter sp. OK098 TaxID=1855297 RepID=UPI00091A9B3C|nr:hypothetical protein [Mucilaginibacter sp. OK098]SHM52748.1 hypothetical protein SAMN05216524_102404 [Mucilaginibacter sp. OK098]
MKKNYAIKGLSIIVIAFMFSACKKSNNSSSSTSGTRMAFAVSADNSASSFASSTGSSLTTNATASITWTSGIANIAYFKLDAKKMNTEIEIKTKSLLNVDLFAPVPTVISTAIDTGTYSEIEIKVVLEKSTSGPIPLTLKGNFTTSTGTVIPIEFDFNDNAVIKAEADNVTVDGKTDLATIIKLHLNKLISNTAAAALEAATRTGGVIVISSTSNTAIYDVIKDKITDCGGFERFEHHDKKDRKNDD